MTEEEYVADVKTVSRDGVIVEREIADEGNGIAGTIEIESRRDEPVLVHVVEDLPSTLAVDDGAFEAGSEPDIGDISPERISVRHNVTGESVRIRYGIVTPEPLAEHGWTSPIIQTVTETELTRSTSVDAPAGAPRTAPNPLEGKSDEPPASDAPETGLDGSTGNGGHDEDPPDRFAAERAGEADGTTADGAADGPGDGTWSDAERRATQAEIPRSLQVRIDHLGARVQEFSAYASSLEALIDERGTASEIVEDLERDLERLDGRLDRLQVDVESLRVSHDEDVDGLRASVDRIDSAVDGVEAEIDAFRAKFDDRLSEIDDVCGDVDSHAAALEAHEQRFDEHDSALDGIEGDVDGVESDLRALEDRLDAFEADLAQFGETLETMESELASVPQDLRTMSEELDAIREEMEQFRSFRKSLAEISNVDK